MNESRLDDAKQALADALAANRQNVRALIQLGDISVQEHRDEDAIVSWKRVEQQNAPYVSLVGDRLIDAFTRLGHGEEGLKLLRSWLDANPSIDLLETVVRATRAAHGIEAANDVARLELHRSPSLLHHHTRRLGRYVCTQCGFKARQFYWQ